MAININLNSKLQWRAGQTLSGRWIAVCDAMNITMEAEDFNQLFNELIPETLHHFFLDLLQDNELASYLKEHGWHANIPQNIPDPEDVKFNVPWEIIAEGVRDSSRAVN